MTFRWGILATGNIANSMAEALHFVEEADLVAVGSRSLDSAETFAKKWNIPNVHGSYQALASDPSVEIIYIATPHAFHFDNMMMCLEAGKHVLCEKPLTLNAYEAQQCISVAKENSCFLMEAIWMRFFPAILKIKQWLAEGLIGNVHLIEADFCFDLPFDPTHRLYNPALGGGALLDLGIYPLSLTTWLLGFPQEVSGDAQIGRTGTDDHNTIICKFADGALAKLTSGVNINKPMAATIYGEDGTIAIHPAFFHPNTVTVSLNGQEPKTHNIPYLGNGYPHEVIEVHNCLRQGKLESDLLPLSETLQMMQLMDGLRAQWGVDYPTEIRPA